MQTGSIKQASPHFKHSLLAFAIANALNAVSVNAATIQVTHEPDNSGAINIPGVGTIDVVCSLREAVTSIEQGSAEPGCINSVADPFGTNDRVISAAPLNFVLAGGNVLSLSKDVTMNLAGSTISADNLGGIFVVSNANVRLENMTLSGASDLTQAIGTLAGNITLNNSTISNNAGRGISALGGELRINNSTISGNSGAGVRFAGSILEVNNSTLASNQLNLDIADGSVYLSNSIIANSQVGEDCRYSTTAPPLIVGGAGTSIIADGSCGGLESGALTGDPRLEPLANNGGLTRTHALKLRSPARNAGNDTCVGSDQRGQARPARGCDIGAFEFGQIEIEVDSHLDDGTGCALREAIASDTTNGCTATQPAPTFVDGTRVIFSPNLESSVITLNASQLTLRDKNVEIDASANAGITINANEQSRVFFIDDSDVLINGLTITGGDADNGAGGGVYARDSDLYLLNSVVQNNTAVIGGGLTIQRGRSVIEDSTINQNSASSSGGGILTISRNRLFVLNSTVSANTAFEGAGLALGEDSETVLRHTTIANNSASRRGSGFLVRSDELFDSNGGSLSATNTIIADASDAADCAFSSPAKVLADSTRGNIIQDGTCGGLAVNPRLLPLSKNGGPTPTHALDENSPARNSGVLQHCREQDQRGFNRTDEDGLCDIGAVEFQYSDVPVNFYVIPIADGKSIVIPL